jgi:hypothetical protein
VSTPPSAAVEIPWRDPAPDRILAPYWFEVPVDPEQPSRTLCIQPVRLKPDFSIELAPIIRLNLTGDLPRASYSDGSAPPGVVLAQDGYRLIATGPAFTKGGLHWAYHYELFSSRVGPVAYQLGELAATAAVVRRNAAMIGSSACRMGRVDLAQSGGLMDVYELSDKSHREGAAINRKSIDAFAWDGTTLVAVDNVMSPKFLFRLSTDETLRVTGQVRVALGDWVNTQLHEAVAGNGVVAISGAYAHRGGNGNHLVVIPSDNSKVWYASEFSPWRDDHLRPQERSTLAGDNVTAWRGLEMFGTTIVVGAGARGMLLVSATTEPTAAVPTISPRGFECTDLRRVGDLLVSLESDGPKSEEGRPKTTRSELVVWQWIDEKPVEAKRHDLPVPAFWFPR